MTMSLNCFTPADSIPSKLYATLVMSELQGLLTSFASLKQVMHALPFLTRRSGTVLPIDCDRLMDALNETRSIVEKGIILLRPQDTLGSCDYSLLLKFHLVVDKICILMDLTESLRSICTADGSETAKILANLQGEIARLLHEHDKIEHEIGREMETLLLALDS